MVNVKIYDACYSEKSNKTKKIIINLFNEVLRIFIDLRPHLLYHFRLTSNAFVNKIKAYRSIGTNTQK